MKGDAVQSAESIFRLPNKRGSFVNFFFFANIFLSQLRKIYGDVYSVYLGTRPAVVINGLQTIKEALVSKGVEFAGRPQDMFVNDAVQRSGKF